MDRDEVLSALRFLHATGSVMYYSDRETKSLRETVFLQPQVLIDAISCFIRESKPENVNEHLRILDCRVLEKQILERDHDRYFKSGLLTLAKN